MKFSVGSRVVTGMNSGVVKFKGKVDFSVGEWIGVALDEPHGKNDGSVAGVQYFECAAEHGLFVKSAQVKLEMTS